MGVGYNSGLPEANALHESGKITDGDITSHYTALCYISHKITSNVLKNYFDKNTLATVDFYYLFLQDV